MHKIFSATVLSSLLAVGGGAALADSGAHSSSPSKAQTSQPSAQGTRANAQGPIGFEEEQVDVPMTVQRIDKKNRNLVLQAPDGTRSTVDVPQGTPGFDSLKKGDKVELEYFEAAVVEPSGSPAKGSAQTGSSTNSNEQSGAGQGASNGNKRVRAIHKLDNTKSQSGNTAPSHDSNGTSRESR